MMADTEFIDGLRVYAPNERAPDYIIANGVLDRDALTAWLAGRAPQIRIVIKRSKGGKYYAAVDTYQRDDAGSAKSSKPVKDFPQPDQGGFEDDDIPFDDGH